MIPGYPLTAPPKVPPVIKKLMTQDPDVDLRFQMRDPIPLFGPVSLRRLANAKRQHLHEQTQKLRAPLPISEAEHLQARAESLDWPMINHDKKLKTQKEFHELRLSSGRYHGTFRSMKPRFLRRRYQHILKGYIPIISGEGSEMMIDHVKWQAERKLLPVERKHMRGYRLADGTIRGQVNENGEFIEALLE
jgi:hypothetical protein